MLKSKGKVSLILALAIVLTMAVALPAGAGTLTDIGEAPWAQQAITEMNAGEIISGYPGGLFKPYQSVTRLEAVAMLIRMQGLEEQAKAMDGAKVDYKMPPNLYWGRGYLIMGVQKGMLDKDHLYQLEPGAPASRAEVAALVYHALSLSAGGSALTFTDTDQIPQGYREFVSAVVENKLMQGLPGNVFKPNDEINRAQMAVLLSNVVEKNLAGNAVQSRYQSGTVTAVSALDTSRWLVSLNSNINKTTASDCKVFLDGKAASLSELKVGDEVKLVLNNSDQVVFIKASRTNTNTTPDVPATAGTMYRGKVDSLLQVGGEYWLGITSFDGTQLTRPVTGGIKVNNSGSQQEVSSLSKGSYVEIKVADNKIVEINSLTPSTVKGSVKSVSSSSLTLSSDSGSEFQLDVPANIIVAKDNSTMTVGDIKEGNRVEVTVLDNKALRIDILSAANMEGVIRDLNTSGIDLLTIRDNNGNIRDYVVESGAEIIQNGSNLRFDDLRVGDQVKLELNSQNRITYIELEGTNSDKLTGEIRQLDTTGTLGITIRNDDGDIKDYVVDDNVEVRRDGSHIRFDDLSTGDRVKLELNSSDQVDYIEVVADNYNTYSGSVIDLQTGDSPWIKIEKSDGTTSRYYIADSYDFYKDSDSIRMRDIVIGSEVKVQVADGKMTRLDVENDSDITITGEVSYVYTDSKKVLLKQSSGNEFSYYLTSDAILKDNSGRTISLYDVDEGWKVQLKLENGKIYRLTEQ